MQTFVFADLAGYTALTEAMGDEEAADLAAAFCGTVRDLLPGRGAEEVKTIGDALMIRAGDAGAAVLLALEIVYDIGGRHLFPTVRVGMHTGQAVERDGDWFGTTVNLAARVAGLAGGDEVLLTDATRAVAGSVVGVEFEARGRHALKNVEQPIVLHIARRAGGQAPTGLPIDPVCRMAVDPDDEAGRLVHAGTVFHFCSLACAARFAAAPERYAH